ncbi:MAG: Glycosyltransferase [Microgenomates group bacterium GW2011_GWF2_45_18]|nr:MAG: Glycosyltransferase [Microgenomates group bacterium GW2011_GWF1_44_10]KKU02018.1 MAG: Glycosyltransferase [Microgenomates group bacterium GW2011_GWF2_45_18]HAU98996.1 glycosyltransferase family 2 protein [Candidatus Paceibacterota bacterium]HAX01290.1 glycosyltransferase family 2 protein [Candidatus Paceibacterota bacterium]
MESYWGPPAFTKTNLLHHYNSMEKISSLSVFLPCYNEAQNIPSMVEDLSAALPTLAKKFEIIVIDDGSTDDTRNVLTSLKKTHPFLRSAHHEKNRGYGASLRTGFSEAKYDWTFWTDGDRQFDITELKTFLPQLHKYQAILGYRINRAEGFRRKLNASLYGLFIDFLFNIQAKDIDCAFKLIKTSTLQSLPITSTGAFVSAELFYQLRKKKIAFIQLPVHHYPRKFGSPTGNNVSVIVKALLEAMKLRIHTIIYRTE